MPFAKICQPPGVGGSGDDDDDDGGDDDDDDDDGDDDDDDDDDERPERPPSGPGRQVQEPHIARNITSDVCEPVGRPCLRNNLSQDHASASRAPRL